MLAPNNFVSFRVPPGHTGAGRDAHGIWGTRVAVSVERDGFTPDPSPERELESVTRGLGLSFLFMTWARPPLTQYRSGWQKSAPGAQHIVGAQKTGRRGWRGCGLEVLCPSHTQGVG